LTREIGMASSKRRNRRRLPLPIIDLSQRLGPDFRLPVRRSNK
jgi:hypothetical protein